jgi:hypothetical protein
MSIIVLEDVEIGFEFGESCAEDLFEQHRDEVGALLDRLAPRGGFVLVSGEPIREIADPLETKPWFMAEKLLVGTPIVLVEVIGQRPGVQGALTRKLEGLERDTDGGGALGQGFVTNSTRPNLRLTFLDSVSSASGRWAG